MLYFDFLYEISQSASKDNSNFRLSSVVRAQEISSFGDFVKCVHPDKDSRTADMGIYRIHNIACRQEGVDFFHNTNSGLLTLQPISFKMVDAK